MKKSCCKENIKENGTKCHSQRFLLGISLVRFRERILGRLLNTGNKQAGDPRQQHSGMTPSLNKSGFTLIEMLVVILIIGILAAIALPQYQKAVHKTLYASMLPVITSVIHAQEAYYLIHGTYATNWNELENVSVPASGSCAISNGPAAGRCRPMNEKICICLGNRNGVSSVMIAFSQHSNVLPTQPSGYEYVFDAVKIKNTGTNTLSKGFYCRENASTNATRTDYHCTGTSKRRDWYGSWFLMN